MTARRRRFAQAGGSDLRREVATEVPRMAHVQRQHLEQVLAEGTVFGEADRRDAKTFLPDFRGGRVVGAMRGAADIAVMGADDRPEKQVISGEDRDEDGQVRQMAAAAIGVVEQVDGLGVGIGHSLHQCLGGPGHGADMDGDMVGLGDQTASRVDQGDGEVPRRVEDLRIGGAQHGLAHFLGDGVQPVLQNRDGNGIDHAGRMSRAAARREVRDLRTVLD